MNGRGGLSFPYRPRLSRHFSSTRALHAKRRTNLRSTGASHIPVDERLPSDVAAPCLAHLLEEEEEGGGGNDSYGSRGKSAASPLASLETETAPRRESSSPSPWADEREGEDDMAENGRKSTSYETPW